MLYAAVVANLNCADADRFVLIRSTRRFLTCSLILIVLTFLSCRLDSSVPVAMPFFLVVVLISTSIHEAMEQQSISISKAGIVTSLQARCSVFAAANPVKGRYDASLSFFDNVDLTEPILSRFDVLCVVRDTVDPTIDETLAKFVVDSHMRSHPDEQDLTTNGDDNVADDEDGGAKRRARDLGRNYSDSGVELIPQDMLRKYLMFAKSTVSPKLANMDKEKISSLYIDLRKESMASGGMPIALRHLESIVRLSEAHARLHLRDYVREGDVDAAIAVMLESFFTSQKYSVMRSLRRHFNRYLSYRKDDNDLLFYVLSGLVRDYASTKAEEGGDSQAIGAGTVEVDMEDFEARAREINVDCCEKFYTSSLFEQRKFTVDRANKKIIKTL
jgi:DNA replication licensing factor MCM2